MECVTVAPEIVMLPLVESTLFDRITSLSAETVTAPEPVVMVWLT